MAGTELESLMSNRNPPFGIAEFSEQFESAYSPRDIDWGSFFTFVGIQMKDSILEVRPKIILIHVALNHFMAFNV